MIIASSHCRQVLSEPSYYVSTPTRRQFPPKISKSTRTSSPSPSPFPPPLPSSYHIVVVVVVVVIVVLVIITKITHTTLHANVSLSNKPSRLSNLLITTSILSYSYLGTEFPKILKKEGVVEYKQANLTVPGTLFFFSFFSFLFLFLYDFSLISLNCLDPAVSLLFLFFSFLLLFSSIFLIPFRIQLPCQKLSTHRKVNPPILTFSTCRVRCYMIVQIRWETFNVCVLRRNMSHLNFSPTVILSVPAYPVPSCPYRSISKIRQMSLGCSDKRLLVVTWRRTFGYNNPFTRRLRRGVMTRRRASNLLAWGAYGGMNL